MSSIWGCNSYLQVYQQRGDADNAEDMHDLQGCFSLLRYRNIFLFWWWIPSIKFSVFNCKIHLETADKGFYQGLEDDGDEGVKVTHLMIMTPTPIVKPWIQDLIEMTMKKMDEDKDGKVSFADFEVDMVIVIFVGVLVVIIIIINKKSHNKRQKPETIKTSLNDYFYRKQNRLLWKMSL